MLGTGAGQARPGGATRISDSDAGVGCRWDLTALLEANSALAADNARLEAPGPALFESRAYPSPGPIRVPGLS